MRHTPDRLAGFTPLRFTAFLLILVAVGCSSIGPQNLERDRLHYADAMSDSWERQMLKNIVKLRYGETIFFLEVDSVINQYSVEATGRLAVTPGGLDDNWVGGTGTYSDRPTVTYTPLRGNAFIRQMLTPIPPAIPFVLSQSGWPIDRMFEITVREVNGVSNISTAGVDQEPDSEFAELMAIFRELQGARALKLQVVQVDDDLKGTQVLLIIDDIPDALVDDARRAAEILRIDPDLRQFRVTYGPVATEPDEIAVLSRSVLEIMMEFSAGIDIPGEHLLDGRAVTSFYDTRSGANLLRLLQVRSGARPSDSAYVSVQHQNQWFWVEEQDLESKSAFSFLNILTQLTSTHGGVRGPVVTVGAGK